MVDRCHAASDGDCWWPQCPQEANNRANYKSVCALEGARRIGCRDCGDNDGTCPLDGQPCAGGDNG